jgi:hypothetical protein
MLRQDGLRATGYQRAPPLPFRHPAKSKRDMIFVLRHQVKVKATGDKQKVALNQQEIRCCPERLRALAPSCAQGKEYKQNQLP